VSDAEGDAVMTPSTPSRQALIGAAVVMTMAAAPHASAAEWVLLASEGTLPHRSVFLADSGYISKRPPDDISPEELAQRARQYKSPADFLNAQMLRGITIVQVLEDAKEPDTINYNLEFKCADNLVRIAEATAWNRDGTSQTKRRPEWIRVPPNWIEGARIIACDEAAWKRTFGKSEDAPRQWSALESTGLRYFGKFGIGTALPGAVWAKLWADGARPAYADDKTLTAEQREKKVQEAVATLGKGVEQLQKESDKMKDELVMDEQFERALKAASSDFRREMSGMAGKTESQIVDLWGPPASVSEANGRRRLTYTFAGTTTGVEGRPVAIVNRQGGVVGQITQNEVVTRAATCERVLLLREGGRFPGYRLYDFQVSCR
jgi:hypothetical protein